MLILFIRTQKGKMMSLIPNHPHYTDVDAVLVLLNYAGSPLLQEDREKHSRRLEDKTLACGSRLIRLEKQSDLPYTWEVTWPTPGNVMQMYEQALKAMAQYLSQEVKIKFPVIAVPWVPHLLTEALAARIIRNAEESGIDVILYSIGEAGTSEL